MSRTNGQDCYLQNLPSNLNDYGLNKTLITRALSIDWKHRDTEINLRNPLLLDKLNLEYDIKELYRIRSNQLRFIYHVGRSVLNDSDPNDLVYTFDHVRDQHFNTDLGNVFIEFSCILQGRFSTETLKNATVFSYKKVKQQDIIKYFVSQNLPIPKQILNFKSFQEFESYLKNNISFVLYTENNFSDMELLYMWCCNYHLFTPYRTDTKITYSRLSYKSDINLPNPVFY